VRRLQREELLRGFFFMRKPPGLRLRFDLGDGATAAEGAIVDYLNGVDGVRWFPSCYEPETFQFGGPQAMEVVHRHAYADALAWWDWEQRPPETKPLGSTVLSLCVLNDLFARVVEGDPDEVWDVWCHVASLHGSSPSNDGAIPRIRIEHLSERASEPERRVLRSYARANRSFARAFERLHAGGKLLHARRLVLPYVALFHWNRYGFALDERQRMYGAMTAAWSPKHALAVTARGGPQG
jgi:thiopeptide-type bacteriocin biosynthesis protein